MSKMYTTLLLLGAALLPVINASTSQFVCPGGNGQTYTDDQGVSYVLSCSSDSSGGAGLGGPVSATGSFSSCLANCDSTSGCTGFTYSGAANGAGGGTCYLKSGQLTPVSSGTNVITVRNANTGIPPPYTGPNVSCPANNLTLVTDQYGVSYVVLCASNRGGGSYVQPGANYGFGDCFGDCSSGNYSSGSTGTGSCNMWTYTGGTNGVGPGICQLGSSPQSQGPQGAPNPTLVAGIRQNYYSGPAPTSTISYTYSGVGPAPTGAGGAVGGAVGAIVTVVVTATATTIVPILPAVTRTVTATTY